MAFDGTLKFDTAIDKSGFESGLSNLGNLARKGMAAVTAAVTAASTAVAGLGTYAVNVGKNFESSMAQVIATMGITKDTIQDGVNSYELLKEAASAAGEATTFSASEAADALNYLALAGYSAAQAADALPAVLDLAAAGGMDLAYASDLATDAMAALGIEATKDNLTRFGDEMAKTASKANTSVSQLGEAILTVGGTAKSLAGGTTELNAALGILANRGIKGSEGGTALRNIILALSAPTDKAAAALAGLGVNAFDADGNLRPLNETFKDLDKALSGMSEGERTQVLNEIFNKVDLKSAQAMLAGCGDEFDSLTAELENCDNAMSQMADTMNDTLEGDIKSLQSKAEAFGIAVYEDMNLPLRDLAQLGGQYISQLTDAFKEGGFEGLAGAFGDVLGQAVTKASEYLPKLVEMGASVVISLVDGIVANADKISDSALRIIGTLTTTLVQLAPKLIEGAAKAITSFAKGITENLPKIKETARKLIIDLTNSLTESLPELVEAGAQILAALIETIAENADVIIDGAVQILGTLVTALVDNLDVLIDAAVQLVLALAEYISENADELADTAIELIGEIVVVLIQNAPKLLAAAIILFGALLEALVTILGKLLKELGEGLAEIGSMLAEGAKSAVSAVGKWFSKLPSEIAEGLSDVLYAVGDWGSDLLIKGRDAAKDLVDGIVKKIKELPGEMVKIGKELVEGIWEGIKSAADWLGDKISDFGSGIVKGAKKVFHINSPSKLMAAEVGKPIAEGIGVGMTDNIPEIGREAVNALTDISPEIKVKASPETDSSALTAYIEAGREAAKALTDISPAIKVRAVPDIDSSAVTALSVQSAVLDSTAAQPSPTSDITTNNYNYSTVNNAPEGDQIIELHAQFVVGEEIVGEGVATVAADKIDQKQGITVKLKERGLA